MSSPAFQSAIVHWRMTVLRFAALRLTNRFVSFEKQTVINWPSMGNSLTISPFDTFRITILLTPGEAIQLPSGDHWSGWPCHTVKDGEVPTSHSLVIRPVARSTIRRYSPPRAASDLPSGEIARDSESNNGRPTTPVQLFSQWRSSHFRMLARTVSSVLVSAGSKVMGLESCAVTGGDRPKTVTIANAAQRVTF